MRQHLSRRRRAMSGAAGALLALSLPATLVPGSSAADSATTTPPSTTSATTTTAPTSTAAAPTAPAVGVPVALSALPATPEAGQTLQLAVLHPPAGASDYRWDLSGRNRFSLDTGPVAQTAAVLRTAGAHTVAVQVATPTGIEIGRLALTVLPRPAAHSPRPPRGERSRTPRAPIRSAAPAPTGRAHTPAERHGAPLGQRALAHTAGDPGVTVADFKFAPGTTTVHVGDTITWTNDGPSPHSATADNGSFDTGLLSKGQSGSHTFTQAGTFTYFCKIHPFMHGTVVVLASTTATTPTTSPSSATPGATSTTPATATSTTAAASSTGPQLPLTGMNLADALLAGLLLLCLGLALRSRAR